ncbi:Alpha/Beta hydrolase fold [Rhypophila sp. PSN 637]
MRWGSAVIPLLLWATGCQATSSGRSLKHAGKRVHEQAQKFHQKLPRDGRRVSARDTNTTTPRFLTSKSQKFSVNGTGIPDVDFDVGESYAGSLPISQKPGEDSNLFFWFFPSTDPDPEQEILIWLNGGPGCSSFEGLIQENGPFLWQYGTYKPVKNPWSWNKLTNIVYIEQPVGTGFSTGTPTITSEEELAQQFLGWWTNFIDTFRTHLKHRDAQCGYTDFVTEFLVYPPKNHAHMPHRLPGTHRNGTTRKECNDIFEDIFDAILWLNPCFDIYQVATTCPLLWDILGFPGSMPYLPAGASIYFNRTDVKTAIHAPLDFNWEGCSEQDVFVNGTDRSLPSSFTSLPRVIEQTGNVMIAHGALDMVLLANGTLLGIQNMTWSGKIGFQKKPVEPFYVPYNTITDEESLAAAGVFGTTHTERGLTYVGVDLSGHMVPQYAPSAAFRQLEFLLGRVDCLDCRKPFTIDLEAPQIEARLARGRRRRGGVMGRERIGLGGREGSELGQSAKGLDGYGM